ncbi:MAG: hypothetical protein ACI8ZO_000059 [Flavobacteriales bacterium]|jgi:hypothetical protein
MVKLANVGYLSFLRGFFTICMFFSGLGQVISQEVSIGAWRTHLPLSNCTKVVLNGNFVFGMTDNGILKYDRGDNSLEKITKQNGLSGVDLTTMAVHEELDIVLIGYQDGQLDLMRGNDIVGLGDIVRSNIIGNKKINQIEIIDNLAYLACGFGVVVYDLQRLEFKETYIIGPNASTLEVFDITILNNQIYASTPSGLYQASAVNVNLIDFNNWSVVQELPKSSFGELEVFQGRLIAENSNAAYNQDTLYQNIDGFWSEFAPGNYYSVEELSVSNNTLLVVHPYGIQWYDTKFSLGPSISNLTAPFRPRSALIDEYGHYWIGSADFGLINKWYDGRTDVLSVNTPKYRDVFNLYSANNKVYSSTGGYGPAMNSIYSTKGYAAYENFEWRNYPVDYERDSVFDIIMTIPDPQDPSVLYAATWNYGLAKYKDNVLIERYDANNSSLQDYEDTGNERVGSLAFDSDHNLWMTNSEAQNPLSVMYDDGTWQSYSMKPFAQGDKMDKFIIHSSGQKWLQVFRKGLIVFDDNNTPTNTNDDVRKFLGAGEGNGNLPSTDVKCLAEDLDGEIWVGTSQGLAVIYNPEFIIENDNIEAQPILINDNGVVNQLLENEGVQAIAVDGANRKWIGTASSGVFLFSENGQEVLANFTTENSPLLSNNILSVAINQTNGEVFVGTEKGLVSYRGTATEGVESFGRVYAFPNPVKPGYDGPIAITGLVGDTQFKITDISGNLVFQGSAEGGQAIWDGKTHEGRKVQTGVYLFFVTNYDGTETAITKIAFIN